MVFVLKEALGTNCLRFQTSCPIFARKFIRHVILVSGMIGRQFSAAAAAAATFQINKQLESLAQESLLARSVQYLVGTPNREQSSISLGNPSPTPTPLSTISSEGLF